MAYKWMPIVLDDQCTGCGLCVEACGPKSLAMVDGIAVLAFPETCGSEEHCISACRDDAIQMAWVPFSGNRSVGQWQEQIAQESVVPSADSQDTFRLRSSANEDVNYTSGRKKTS